MKNKRERGFTLIEMLIVTAMMGLVAAALLVNFRSGEKSKRVQLSRDGIISAIRRAQNEALIGAQIPQNAASVRGSARCPNNNAAASYWVEFQPNGNYSLMAEDTCGAVIGIESYKLVEKTIFVPGDPFQVNNVTQPYLAVRFVPPFGTMSVSDDLNPTPNTFANFEWAELHFQDPDGDRTNEVTVDSISGRIE